MRLKVTSFTARSFDLDYIDLWWEIETFTRSVDVISAYRFTISRSESPEGPFEAITPPFTDQFHFRDFSVNLLHKWRQLYYKLTVTDLRNSESVDVGVATIEAEPDLISLEIQRQEDVLLRNFTGRRCILFPVRTFGEKCSCFDTVLNRQTRSNCLLCYDTGFIGGYLTPIGFYMQIDPDAKAPSNTAVIGETQPRNTSGRLISYPPIKPKDLIVEPENKRWKVVTVNTTERLRSVVHQELALHMIPRGDIEFKLPINLADLNNQLWADDRNFTNPQHIDPQDRYGDLLSVSDDRPRGAIK